MTHHGLNENKGLHASHSHTSALITIANATFVLIIHDMPRAAGATEQVKRWNVSDTAKFKTQVKDGKIDIDNITPTFIESVRVNHGWEPRSKLRRQLQKDCKLDLS
jgi:hypothetical protein